MWVLMGASHMLSAVWKAWQHVLTKGHHIIKQEPLHRDMPQRRNWNRKADATRRRTLTATSWSLYSPRYTTP